MVSLRKSGQTVVSYHFLAAKPFCFHVAVCLRGAAKRFCDSAWSVAGLFYLYPEFAIEEPVENYPIDSEMDILYLAGIQPGVSFFRGTE
jgi:hypothetical protein